MTACCRALTVLPHVLRPAVHAVCVLALLLLLRSSPVEELLQRADEVGQRQAVVADHACGMDRRRTGT